MGYGRDTKICILEKIWYTGWKKAITEKTGFSRMLQGMVIVEIDDCWSVSNDIGACRKIGNNTYRGTTWQILFNLRNVSKNGEYTLRIAVASATMATIQVGILQ